jgi:hypothetical protein
MKFLPYRGEANQLGALLFGMGGLGAGKVLGPFLQKAVFTGAGAYLAYAGLTAPTTRRMLAKYIDVQTQIIRAAGRGTQAAIDTRLHRAFLIKLMEGQADLDAPPLTEEELLGLEHEDDAEKKQATADAQVGQ